MKHVRSKKQLTLNHETIRHLKALAEAQLVAARGGGLIGDGDSGGTCTNIGMGC